MCIPKKAVEQLVIEAQAKIEYLTNEQLRSALAGCPGEGAKPA